VSSNTTANKVRATTSVTSNTTVHKVRANTSVTSNTTAHKVRAPTSVSSVTTKVRATTSVSSNTTVHKEGPKKVQSKPNKKDNHNKRGKSVSSATSFRSAHSHTPAPQPKLPKVRADLGHQGDCGGDKGAKLGDQFWCTDKALNKKTHCTQHQTNAYICCTKLFGCDIDDFFSMKVWKY